MHLVQEDSQVFRVSNDVREGVTTVMGVWHHNSIMLESPGRAKSSVQLSLAPHRILH